jgi:hypothetical protein
MSTHKARFLDTIHCVDKPTVQVRVPFAIQSTPEIVLQAVSSSVRIQKSGASSQNPGAGDQETEPSIEERYASSNLLLSSS